MSGRFSYSGVELALRQMRAGQQCLVRCESRFAYGPDGCPATKSGDVDLPANEDVELAIELVDVLATTSPSDMTTDEAIAEAQRKKVVGNGHFERAAYKKALRAYTSASNTVADLNLPDQDSNSFREARQIRIDCGNNVATACVRLGELGKAKEAAVSVLELDPDNVKALFRAGQVSSRQSNFVEAKLALGKAYDLNPQSKEIKAELGRLSVRIKAYQTKRQAMQETMGSGLFAQPNGKSNNSQGNGHASSTTSLARGEDPQVAKTARHAGKVLPSSKDLGEVGPLRNSEDAKPSSPFGWGQCRMVSASVLVALAAWGALYVSVVPLRSSSGSS